MTDTQVDWICFYCHSHQTNKDEPIRCSTCNGILFFLGKIVGTHVEPQTIKEASKYF